MKYVLATLTGTCMHQGVKPRSASLLVEGMGGGAETEGRAILGQPTEMVELKIYAKLFFPLPPFLTPPHNIWHFIALFQKHFLEKKFNVIWMNTL